MARYYFLPTQYIMGYFGFVLSSGGGRCFTPAYVNPHLIANDTSLFLLSISSISSGASNSPIKITKS